MEKRTRDVQFDAQGEATRKRIEVVDQIGRDYKETKEQLDEVYQKAKKQAQNKEAKKQADEAHKKAIKQAKTL